jgi:hypothetical protein
MLDQRRRSYDGATAGQLRQQVIAGKRRAFSRELLIGTVLLARNRYCLFELPFDRISLGKQLGDILVRDPRLELCVRNRFGSRESILNREEAEEQQISNDPDPSVNPAAPRIRRLPFRKSLGSPRSLRRAVSTRLGELPTLWRIGRGRRSFGFHVRPLVLDPV